MFVIVIVIVAAGGCDIENIDDHNDDYCGLFCLCFLFLIWLLLLLFVFVMMNKAGIVGEDGII